MARNRTELVTVSASMAQEITERLNHVSGEVSMIKGSQAALQRDVHHMSAHIKSISESQKEMAQAVVKLAKISERMDRAISDISDLDERSRHIQKELEEIKESRSTKDHEQDRRIDQVESFVKWAKWLIGAGLVTALGVFIKKLIG